MISHSISIEQFETFIQESMHFWNIPGCSIAWVQEDQIFLAKGYGKKRLFDTTLENQVNATTLFPIASLTKPFTAATIGLLVDRKDLHWHDPVNHYFTQFQLVDPYATQHLTIHDCLSMQSGLQGPSVNELVWEDAHASSEQLLSKLRQIPFLCGFRGCFAYQNLLYLLMGKVIEHNQKMSWEEFVEKNLLVPLHMTQTFTQFDILYTIENKAYPHQEEGGSLKEVPFENLANIAPCAGMLSCAADMAKWLQMLLKNKDALIQPNTLATILSPHIIASAEQFFGEDHRQLQDIFFPHSHFLTYGYGGFIHDYKGLKIYQTPGLTDGMTGLMALIPELNTGLVILYNVETPFFGHAVLFHLLDSYIGEQTDWNQTFTNFKESFL